MPTNPIKNLLDRDANKNSPLFNNASELLQEVVNYGTVVFDKCNRKVGEQSKGTNELQDAFAVISSLFLNILEMLDAVEVLLSKSIVLPTELLLRNIFETLLYLEWILKANTIERAHEYYVEDYLDRIEKHRSLDTTQAKGREVRKLIQKDKCELSAIPFPDNMSIQKRISDYENVLNKPHFKEAYAKFIAYKKKYPKRKDSRWYFLDANINSLKELADNLGRPAEYWFLYKNWSGTMHGQYRLRKKLLRNGRFKGLRNPEGLDLSVSYSVSFALTAMKGMLDFYCPEELTTYEEWLKTEIETKCAFFDKIKINIKYQ